jgi:hypothetical protein
MLLLCVSLSNVSRLHGKCNGDFETALILQVKNYFRDYRARRQLKGDSSSAACAPLPLNKRNSVTSLKSRRPLEEVPHELAQDFNSTIILHNERIAGLSSGASSSHPDSPATVSASQRSNSDILHPNMHPCTSNFHPGSPSGSRIPTHAALITSGDAAAHYPPGASANSIQRINKKSPEILRCPTSSMRDMYLAAQLYQEGRVQDRRFQSDPSEGTGLLIQDLYILVQT